MTRLPQRGFWCGAIVALGTWTLGWQAGAAWAQPPGSPSQEKPGVSVNDARAYRGYTLVTPMNSTSSYLIDLEGRVVRSWKSQYMPALSVYLLENGHLLRTGAQPGTSFGGAATGGRIQEFSWDGELLWDFHLSTQRNHPHHDICPMPNGNVLVIAWDRKTEEETIAAGRSPKSVHGDFLPDCILEVKPTGKTSGEIVWQWHAWDHLIQELDKTKPNYGPVAEHPELIDINFNTGAMASMMADPQQLARLRSLGYVGGGQAKPDRDNPRPIQDGRQPQGGRNPQGGPGRPGGPPAPDWMHTNSVAYNAELDQILLSIHEFSEIWIIDHSTTTAEAASHQGGRCKMRGDLLYRWGNPQAYRNGSNADRRLFAQHCAHWIPKGYPGAGHVVLFNNGGQRPGGTYSSVDEIELPLQSDGRYARQEYMPYGPDRATWSYTAPDKGSFFAMNISGAQRLPNGNTLVCYGTAAVLFEVTAGKDTVWRIALPNRGPGGGPGGFGPPRPGTILPPFIADAMNLTKQQRASVDELQKDVDVQLAKILTKEQKAMLDDPQRSFGPPGFGPPGFGPPGFGPLGFNLPGFGPRNNGGGPGGPPGGPGGGPPGGPSGLFTSYRYGADYPGLGGKELTPGKKLVDILAAQDPSKDRPPR